MFCFKENAGMGVLIFLAIFLSTCAGKIEGPADCPVDCSNAINAMSETKITALVPSVTINCHGSVVPKVVELLFKIEATSGKTGGGGAAIPRPSISYRPLFNGSYDPGHNDHEEVEYKGIATPKSQWCSSACGVAKINLWPQCEEGATRTHTLSIISGPIASEPITITMADDSGEGG